MPNENQRMLVMKEGNLYVAVLMNLEWRDPSPAAALALLRKMHRALDTLDGDTTTAPLRT